MCNKSKCLLSSKAPSENVRRIKYDLKTNNNWIEIDHRNEPVEGTIQQSFKFKISISSLEWKDILISPSNRKRLNLLCP